MRRWRRREAKADRITTVIPTRPPGCVHWCSQQPPDRSAGDGRHRSCQLPGRVDPVPKPPAQHPRHRHQRKTRHSIGNDRSGQTGDAEDTAVLEVVDRLLRPPLVNERGHHPEAATNDTLGRGCQAIAASIAEATQERAGTDRAQHLSLDTGGLVRIEPPAGPLRLQAGYSVPCCQSFRYSIWSAVRVSSEAPRAANLMEATSSSISAGKV